MRADFSRLYFSSLLALKEFSFAPISVATPVRQLPIAQNAACLKRKVYKYLQS
jgi:hypothetical protein